ncbi:MAG TPA: hypothetical protein VK601_18240, partial [Kofleriaceae bacterium]|nr:hypothetical protein [Kofleriaceae bacterium]
TCLVTSLSAGSGNEDTEIGISSLIDTWIQVRDLEFASERTRGLYLVKSRGMGHSNQVREFLITSRGISILPVVIGDAGVVTGSARATSASQLEDAARVRERDAARRQRELERKRGAIEAQIAVMRLQLEAEEDDSRAVDAALHDREQRTADHHAALSHNRNQRRTTNGRRS